MNIAIVGSRGFKNARLVQHIFDRLDQLHPYWTMISGHAIGADRLAEAEAIRRNMGSIIFPPEWDRLGKSAGFQRNTTIVDNAEIVIALCNEKVTSGTADTIKRARDANLPVHVFTTTDGWTSYNL